MCPYYKTVSLYSSWYAKDRAIVVIISDFVNAWIHGVMGSSPQNLESKQNK